MITKVLMLDHVSVAVSVGDAWAGGPDASSWRVTLLRYGIWSLEGTSEGTTMFSTADGLGFW